ncbi:MAG TPA: AAA family ATPase [Candidatus Eisenbacteria bacterium]|nr:AAA family ATPase [Candidatus Eisenbacteria bacterium]
MAFDVVEPEEIAEALAILAEKVDPPAPNRWADATADEKSGIVRDAATTRLRLVEQEREASRPLTEDELALLAEIETAHLERIGATFQEPEDRGLAVLSDLGEVEYVEDLVRPGRIVTVAAEEGSGKSYAVTGELGIRVAIAGGSFAGTWPVVATGAVLVLSEMHADDDYAREATILESLELERAALAGRYFRLPLMTAAGGQPALLADDWLEWITAWLRERQAILLVVDTATGASQVDPWGRDIQSVYRRLRGVLAAYPALAVILIVHLKKPQGNGERRISDVLGEWGRWCDVILLLEHDGTRTKLTTRKRIRHERRIAATKAGGLLVDPVDLEETKGTKVAPDAVLAAIAADPGLSFAALAATLGVGKATAARYVDALGESVEGLPTGPRGAIRLYLTASPPQTASRADDAVDESDLTSADLRPPQRLTTYIGEAVDDAVVVEDAAKPPCFADPDLFRAHADHRRQVGFAIVCDACPAPGSEAAS